ncbi:MAG: cupin domain-containing protein [Chloroflexi bacterium]|nr:MAG: cupin domain-containing protein [Chloroflexota bacterium]
MMISIENPEHYIWGGNCDGWHLLKRDDMSVIQERVPAGCAEVRHSHERARQFFHILEGMGTVIFEDREINLEKGKGMEIEPMVKHQFINNSQADVHFLVISIPSTRRDRVNL